MARVIKIKETFKHLKAAIRDQQQKIRARNDEAVGTTDKDAICYLNNANQQAALRIRVLKEMIVAKRAAKKRKHK